MTSQLEISTPLSVLDVKTFTPGRSIAEVFAAEPSLQRLPVIASLNGRPVLRQDRGWELTRLGESDVLAFRVLPQGGGDNTILRTVLLLAATVAATVIAGPLGLGLSGLTATLAVSGITIGAGLLINVLLPNKPAALAAPGSAAAASPTYSIGAQGNQARLFQPQPQLYGRHILYPDFAAVPWTRYVGNEQYLHQLFVLGLGEYEVEEVNIGAVAVWDNIDGYTTNFDDVQIAFYRPGVAVDMFPTEVFVSKEVSGQELRCFSIGATGGGQSFTFGTDTVHTFTPPVSALFNFTGLRTGDPVIVSGGGNDGSYVVHDVEPGGALITMRTLFPHAGNFQGRLTLTNVVGPFPACPPGVKIDTLEVDFVFPNGLYIANDDGTLAAQTVAVTVEVRTIDDNGDPLGAFAVAGNHSYTASSQTPQRFTQSYSFGPARLEVLVTRTSNQLLDNRSQTSMQWTGLKGFVTSAAGVFPNVTIMATQIRATSNLSAQQAQSWNTIQIAKLPVWNGTTWSAPQPTRSIAWAAADMLRNPLHGVARADRDIDLPRFLELDALWAARGDSFNGVFDSKQPFWDALTSLCAAGRARPVLVGNILTLVRDGPPVTYKGVFTPRNIKKGSFEINHILYDETTPDDVIVQYVNETTWVQDEVDCALLDSDGLNPGRVSIFGVTTPAQAKREGLYRAAANTFRRVLISFSTEMEGKLLVKGDPIYVSHPLINGQSGEVKTDLGNFRLRFSERADWSTADARYIVLTTPANRPWGPVLVTRGNFDDEVKLDNASRTATEAALGPLAGFLAPADTSQAPTRYLFGVAAGFARRCKIAAITPRSQTEIALVAVVDDDLVYQAEDGTVSIIKPRLLPLPNDVFAPADIFAVRDVFNVQARQSTGIGGQQF